MLVEALPEVAEMRQLLVVVAFFKPKMLLTTVNDSKVTMNASVTVVG